jgi:hypothetical protein
MGLPASAEIVLAASSARSRSNAATPSRISARRCAGSGSSSTLAAASTARRACSAVACGTRPTGSPE